MPSFPARSVISLLPPTLESSDNVRMLQFEQRPSRRYFRFFSWKRVFKHQRSHVPQCKLRQVIDPSSGLYLVAMCVTTGVSRFVATEVSIEHDPAVFRRAVLRHLLHGDRPDLHSHDKASHVCMWHRHATEWECLWLLCDEALAVVSELRHGVRHLLVHCFDFVGPHRLRQESQSLEKSPP